jgi:hypothetical protein
VFNFHQVGVAAVSALANSCHVSVRFVGQLSRGSGVAPSARYM